MNELKYTEGHAWIRSAADGTVTIGITEYAQDQLGDVVYVELPEPGKVLQKGENAADFWSIAGDCHSLQGVLWGHIHQDYQETRKGIELFGTPSTCKQFRPATEEPEMDCLPPAFRSLELYPDGRITTKLHWQYNPPPV